MQPDPALEFARQSLMSYACLQWSGYEPAAHHHLIAQYLEKVERGEIKRLIIQSPPRSGKSMIVSTYFPAWYMGKNPDKRVVCASYGQELASDFGRAVRNQFSDTLFLQIFPGVRLAEDSAAADKFELAPPRRGGYVAVGVGGALTGRGAHILLVDDPIKGREDGDSEAHQRRLKDWYTAVAYTRLMDEGSIIICQTRWNINDLAGWVIKEHKHENWVILNLPAINNKGEALWPERFPLHVLHGIKKTLPSRDWEALYQQKPFAEEGNIYKRDWWKRWPENKPLPECSFILVSFDTAFSDAERKKSSYSACVVLGVFKRPDDECHQILLIDSWKKRLEYPDLRKEVRRMYQDHSPDKMIIEKKASGISIIQDLRRGGIPLSTYTPERDKITRAYAASGLLESGLIYCPTRRWADEFISSLARFPNPEDDDVADAFSQAVIFLQNGLLVAHAEDAARRASEDEDEEDIYADESLSGNVRRLKPKKKRAAYG